MIPDVDWVVARSGRAVAVGKWHRPPHARTLFVPCTSFCITPAITRMSGSSALCMVMLVHTVVYPSTSTIIINQPECWQRQRQRQPQPHSPNASVPTRLLQANLRKPCPGLFLTISPGRPVAPFRVYRPAPARDIVIQYNTRPVRVRVCVGHVGLMFSSEPREV